MWISGSSISAESRSAPRWKSEKIRNPAWKARSLDSASPLADRGGGVLADPEVQVAPGPVVRR